MKILVVDDEIEICHLIKLLFLADFPCQVDIVFNGKEAIDAISNEQFDLIICDQNMPEKNGNEVFQYINNNSINLPFVLATTEEWEHVPYFTTNPLFFQIQKPQIAEGITKLIKKLKDEPSDVRVEEGDLVVEFSPVPIEIIYKMGALPVDIYLKIRDGKFLKVIRAGDKVLDLGAAPGSWTQYVDELGAKVDAVDVNEVKFGNWIKVDINNTIKIACDCFHYTF